ncbi:hypothetical protein EDB81DRAFT_883686 [Dactylonectria macrodidyma]|uniref:Peptidase S8/S53 domain-containing protein n=1 Tax=Dactylonectria macrodidyma TaxID=307937 RepID=A0A9P9EX57_9HYPO|nr:hypothetical protein EDB81DRAFT_883686 [Dactylonectria macrodidyma]
MSLFWYPPEALRRVPTDDRDLTNREYGVSAGQQPIYERGFKLRMKALLADLIARGVVPVTGSSNDGIIGTLTGAPAVFGRKDSAGNPELPALLVAGTVEGAYDGDVKGGFATSVSKSVNIDDDGGLPNIWAPGYKNSVPDGGKAAVWEPGYHLENYRNSSGTSSSAALTAGLAAYFIKMKWAGQLKPTDETPLGIKNHILDTAWTRVAKNDDTRKVQAIWNGVKLTKRYKYCFWKKPKSLFGPSRDLVSRADNLLGEKPYAGNPYADDIYKRASESASATVATSTISRTSSAEPAKTNVSCEEDSDCSEYECDENQAPACLVALLDFDANICYCQNPSTITSATEPTNTTVTCEEDSDCNNYECEEDQTPACFAGLFNFDENICYCQNPSTTTSSVEPTASTLACDTDDGCSANQCPEDGTAHCSILGGLTGSGFCVCPSTETEAPTTSEKQTSTSTTAELAATVTKWPLEIKGVVCNDEATFQITKIISPESGYIERNYTASSFTASFNASWIEILSRTSTSKMLAILLGTVRGMPGKSLVIIGKTVPSMQAACGIG